MARAYFVKAARKDNPAVKKGESYWWWKFAYGSKQYSKEKPKPSQLTNSPFLSDLYGIQEDILSMDDPTNLLEIMERIEDLRYQCEDSLENMPEQLQETSDSGMMLQERIDALELWYDELDGIDVEMDEDEDDPKAWIEDRLSEIQNCEVAV